MRYSVVNLKEKLNTFSEHFTLKIVVQMNDYHFKVVKFQGDFVWYSHADTDEAFIVLDGEMNIDFLDGRIDLKRGEMFVVSKGVKHKPFAKDECRLALIEPAGTRNTGDSDGELTTEDDVWI